MKNINNKITANHQLLISFILLLICISLRILDIFIFRLDDLLGEIIVSKFLGFVVIVVCIKFTGQKLESVGLHSYDLHRNIKFGIMLVFLALFLSYGTQFVYLVFNNGGPVFTFNDYNLLSFILFVLIGNIINSLMEEGLFRGIILRSFLNYMPFWFANVLQSLLFGLWHIIWPIKLYATGQISLQGAIMNAIVYTIFSGMMGFLMGYLFYKTSNLWITITWHTIWNACLNLLIIQSTVFNDDSEIMVLSNNAFWIGFTISVISTIILMRTFKRDQNIGDAI